MSSCDRLRWGAVVLVCLGLWPIKAAQAAEVPVQLEAPLLKLGKTYLDRHDYTLAIAACQAAFDLVPSAAALGALAKAQHLAGRDDEAIATYRLFLRRFPESPSRPQIAAKLLEIETAVAAAHAPPEVVPAPLVVAARPAPAPAPRPVYRRWWFWTALGVAAAGAVAGVTVGVLAAQRPPDGPSLHSIQF